MLCAVWAYKNGSICEERGKKVCLSVSRTCDHTAEGAELPLQEDQTTEHIIWTMIVMVAIDKMQGLDISWDVLVKMLWMPKKNISVALDEIQSSHVLYLSLRIKRVI